MTGDMLKRGISRGEADTRYLVVPGYPPLARDLCDLMQILENYGLVVDGFAFDNVIFDYVQATQDHGGRLSAAEMKAADAFVTGCQNDGIWDLLDRVNFQVGDSLAAVEVPLLGRKGALYDTLTNFVDSDYSPATGLAITDATRHVDIGINPSVDLDPTNHALSVFSVGITDSYLIGSTVTSPNRIGLRLVSGASRRYYAGNGTTSAAAVGTTINGFYTGTRSGNDVHAYYNGVSDATGTATTATFSGCTDLQLPPPGLSNPGGYLRGYAVTKGLNAAQAAALQARFQAFNVAVGRAV